MTSGRPFRLLVFDWDGTLMDSVANIVTSLEHALDDLDLEPLPEETIRATIGLGMQETRAALLPDCDDAVWQAIVEKYRHHWFHTYRDACVLFDGARGVLEELGAAGYLMAVATGKSRRGLDRDLEETGLHGLFHTTRTADEARSKPNPQMLLEILDELRTQAGESLMIGDTTHDLEMARHAGVPALAVTSGSHPREWLEPLAPIRILTSVVDLPDWLQRGDEETPDEG